ncbi:MAG: alpha/beta hydrolase [Alphaproteobacteria bacterium]|nr:alpha/beta hydrolase [Alphaproteobacteria bacterium]
MIPSNGSAPYVTPATAAILARMRAAAPIDYATMPIAEGRRAFIQSNQMWNEQPPPVTDVRDLSVRGATGPMRARLFRPRADARLPVVVYVHGGGWTFGDVDTHDRCMRVLATESDACVLGIDYRLAPEHPFPAALDDTLAALDWLVRAGPAEGLEPSTVALAGDSAGANIALAVLIASRDRHRWSPATAALFYGCFAPLFDTASHRRFGDGSYGLSTARMRWYWRNYLGALPETTTALAAPLHADFAGLPPLFLNAAGLDPLLDDTLLLAMRLAHAGTACELDIVPGVLHGFLQQTREEPAAVTALERAGRFLRTKLAG